MNNGRVFIVCQPQVRQANGTTRNFDFSPAMKFGRLEVLVPHTQSLLAPVVTVRNLRDKLADFSDDDYILPVGDPSLIATVAMVASKMNHGRVKFLKWEKSMTDYLVINVDITGAAQ